MASQEVTFDGKRVGTISVGICLLAEPLAPEEPLSRADIAMYAVKDGAATGSRSIQATEASRGQTKP